MSEMATRLDQAALAIRALGSANSRRIDLPVIEDAAAAIRNLIASEARLRAALEKAVHWYADEDPRDLPLAQGRPHRTGAQAMILKGKLSSIQPTQTNDDIEIDRRLAALVKGMAIGTSLDSNTLHELAGLLRDRADRRQWEINR